MKLKPHDLDSRGFSEFGTVVSTSIRKPDHNGDTYDWWADLALFDNLDQRYGVGLAVVKTQPFSQSRVERHLKTPEFFLPVGGDMFIIIGPPDHPEEPSRLPDLSRFAAFRVREGEGVLLKPGVWHYVPFPLKDAIHMFVVFAEGTSKRDHFEEEFPNGATLEIELQ
jgi:ureidoglycolate hydrolase